MKTKSKMAVSLNKKNLKTLANKCERLSREYTKLRDTSCACGCGKTYGLDWAHGISRERERFKYHPLNTMRLNHNCHMAIDHSPIKSVLMNQLMNRRIGELSWQLMLLESFSVFKPTEQFYLEQIAELEKLIAEVQSVQY